MLLHDQKGELKELVPHIGERLLTIRILKEVFQADKEKVCTIYNTFSFSIEVHLSSKYPAVPASLVAHL